MYRSLQALILALLGLFLLNRIQSGRITWYINARFMPLTLLGAAGLLLIAGAISSAGGEAADHDGHNHAANRNALPLLMLALVFLLGSSFQTVRWGRRRFPLAG